MQQRFAINLIFDRNYKCTGQGKNTATRARENIVKNSKVFSSTVTVIFLKIMTLYAHCKCCVRVFFACRPINCSSIYDYMTMISLQFWNCVQLVHCVAISTGFLDVDVDCYRICKCHRRTFLFSIFKCTRLFSSKLLGGGDEQKLQRYIERQQATVPISCPLFKAADDCVLNTESPAYYREWFMISIEIQQSFIVNLQKHLTQLARSSDNFWLSTLFYT